MTTQKFIADIEAQDVSTIQMNALYYPGWGVTVNGIRVPVLFDNPKGVMQVEVPAGTHQLVAEFRETPARFAADIVSVVSCILLIVILRYTGGKI